VAPALAAERISSFFCYSFVLRIEGDGTDGLHCWLERGCRNIVLEETIRMIGGTSDGERVDVRYLRCLVAARSCMDGATDQARQCGDASAAMEFVGRVAGIVDPDESLLSLEPGDGFREGLAERQIASTFVGDGVDQELWTAFLESQCQDVDSLSRLCAEPLSSTPALSSRREERMVARGSDSLGASKPVAAVPDLVTLGHSFGTDGDMLSEAESRHWGREALSGTSTSSFEAADVPASSVSAVEASTPKSMMKSSRLGEVVPLRRSRRIAERSAIAGTGASSLLR
jgi:hypothetical protein